ncbi:hypothetical protein Bca101_077528 [Brassica carinata]
MKSEQTVTPFTAAVNGGLAGAIYGGIAGMIIPLLFRRLYRGIAPLSQAQYVRKFARECSALAAAGGGLAYSFVNRGLKLKPSHALFCAAGCAVLSGTEYKMNEIFSATSEDSTRGKAFDT